MSDEMLQDLLTAAADGNYSDAMIGSMFRTRVSVVATLQAKLAEAEKRCKHAESAAAEHLRRKRVSNAKCEEYRKKLAEADKFIADMGSELRTTRDFCDKMQEQRDAAEQKLAEAEAWSSKWKGTAELLTDTLEQKAKKLAEAEAVIAAKDARLALADGLAEACDELTGWCDLVSVDPNDRHDITKMREWASKVIDRTAFYRNADANHRAAVALDMRNRVKALAAEIDKELTT